MPAYKCPHVQVIDFGLAAIWTPGKLLRMHCGSPSYAAPEIVARKMYEGPPVDVWSLGVVLHAMLCGRLPFVGTKGDKQVHFKLLEVDVMRDCKRWSAWCIATGRSGAAMGAHGQLHWQQIWRLCSQVQMQQWA